jgi:two-component system CitB family response regulator/two-component system response regulator DcuR
MEPVKVLVVEDDLKISEIHRRFVEKIPGFQAVGVANTLEEAEEFVEILEPDLVLLDVFFPEGSGIDLIWKIRARQRPVDLILITAAKEIAPLQEAIRGGAFDYLIKPVIFNRFAQSLNRYLETRNRLAAAGQLEQQDVDRLLQSRPETAPEREALPKGIDGITLEKVRRVFSTEGPPGGLSADDIGRQAGMSRSTARRYLEYLAESGWLCADLIYGTVGRPERKYKRRS